MEILVRNKLVIESAWLGRVSNRTILAMLLALLAMGSARVYAGINIWTSHGPEGGYVNAPVIDPQDLSERMAFLQQYDPWSRNETEYIH